MSVGEALAEARHRAGLSVAQVSQRTRIREAIICDIETDDYSGCGGDFYARGHIRGIAKVTGADPGPLIREYDTARRVPPTLTLADIFPDTPPTPATSAAPGNTRGRRQLTPVLALASLAALVMALGFMVSGLPSGSRHAAAAAPRAPARPATLSLPRPAWRASAAVPAHPPARPPAPASTAAASPSDGRGSTPQAGAAAARPRYAPGQARQLVRHRPLGQPGSGNRPARALRPPGDDRRRADHPRQRSPHRVPTARQDRPRPGRHAAHRGHRPHGQPGAAAARHARPPR